jgi:hypothetical protein
MQRTNLAGKYEDNEVTIIGNDPKSNAKPTTTQTMVCYNCGKSFKTNDKKATMCNACKKIYNKPIINPQATFSQHAYLGLVYFFLIGAGLAFLWFIIFCIGLLFGQVW